MKQNKQDKKITAQTLLQPNAYAGKFRLHEFCIGEAGKGYLMLGIDAIAVSSKHIVFPHGHISAENHTAEDNRL